MRRSTLFAAATSAALALVLASPAGAEPPAPAPTPSVAEAPAYPPPSTRWAGMAVGLGTTAFFYGAAAGASYLFPDAPGARDLRLPVIGPWLAIAHNGCPADEPDCGPLMVVVRSVLTAIDGAAQAGGLAILIESAFMPTQVRSSSSDTAPGAPRSPTPPAAPPAEPKPGENKNLFFLPTPMTLGLRGIGVGVVGRF